MNNLPAIPQYYAHSAPNQPYEIWQTLKTHLNTVAEMAAEFANVFNAQDIAYFTALLHDLGKYCPEFNKRLHRESISVDHSTAGAKIAIEKYSNQMGKSLAATLNP